MSTYINETTDSSLGLRATMDGLKLSSNSVADIKENEEALKSLRWKFEALLGSTMEQVTLEAPNKASQFLKRCQSLQVEVDNLKEHNSVLDSKRHTHVSVRLELIHIARLN